MPSTISLVDQIIVGYFEASPCAEERDAKRGLPRDLEVEQLSRRLRSKHAAQVVMPKFKLKFIRARGAAANEGGRGRVWAGSARKGVGGRFA